MVQGYCATFDKFCFIPILKCASMAVLNALVFVPEIKNDNFISNPTALNLYVVALLRDPTSRFISAYNYRQQNKEPGLRDEETPWDVLNNLENLEDMHFEKQSWFLAGIEPDFMGRIEQMTLFEQKIGIEIPKINAQQNNRFAKHQSINLLRTIKEYYTEDYLLLEKYF
jgi:hypothetical protein